MCPSNNKNTSKGFKRKRVSSYKYSNLSLMPVIFLVPHQDKKQTWKYASPFLQSKLKYDWNAVASVGGRCWHIYTLLCVCLVY